MNLPRFIDEGGRRCLLRFTLAAFAVFLLCSRRIAPMLRQLLRRIQSSSQLPARLSGAKILRALDCIERAFNLACLPFEQVIKFGVEGLKREHIRVMSLLAGHPDDSFRAFPYWLVRMPVVSVAVAVG